ncbi:Gfo/Idh/MocA family protein [Sediminispirochaeta bajacaliforniensis]|uniref:Gfo/Idh/MocA family protein n=1 Tax=Sediminispirochaeta bajacaliforniensis TaxID=148 RepID=UPI00035E64FA|nr:Gfo/Idh/MocA family oxidoreductase [Sediminispirochaeta bajacaliforniensis]
MKKEPLRFGLIGYGKVARLHAIALRAADGARLVAVAGRNKQRRDLFAAEFSIVSRDSAEAMVQKDGVDAVIITTPHPNHRDAAIEAFAAGCHVLVEKPMALTTAQCDEMIEAGKRAGRLLSVVSQRRWYPSCSRIKKAINEGKLGKPALAQVTILGWRDEAYYRSDSWRGSWEAEGGGVLINQAPHQLDLLCWYMGSVAEVKGFWDNINHPYIEVEDSAVAAVRFKNGGMASLLLSNSQRPGIYAKVHIHGDSGSSAGVQTDGGAMFVAGQSGILEPPVNDLWTIPGEEGNLDVWEKEDTAFFKSIEPTTWFFGRQIEDFADAVANDRPPAVTGEEGRETVRLIEAVYHSDPKKR